MPWWSRPDAALPDPLYLESRIAVNPSAFRKALHGGVCWTVMAARLSEIALAEASTDREIHRLPSLAT